MFHKPNGIMLLGIQDHSLPQKIGPPDSLPKSRKSSAQSFCGRAEDGGSLSPRGWFISYGISAHQPPGRPGLKSCALSTKPTALLADGLEIKNHSYCRYHSCAETFPLHPPYRVTVGYWCFPMCFIKPLSSWVMILIKTGLDSPGSVIDNHQRDIQFEHHRHQASELSR